MTAMTLLRAMSDISPQDIEAALRAGHDAEADADASSAEERRGIGRVIGSAAPPAESPSVRLPLGGWLAAAACLVLTTGIILHFRQADSGLVLAPSVPDQIVEITGTETTAATDSSPETNAADAASHTAYTTATTEANAVVTVIGEDGDGGGTAPDSDAPPASQQADTPTTAPPASDTQPPETTTAAAYAENIPVLIAMADDAGRLTHADGSALADGEHTWELYTDAAAIGDYLEGGQPVVTLGSGQKSDSVTEQIMQNAEMLRIRWQITDAAWESYGIQYANLDRNGVLHLDIAMYSAGTPQPESDWVYETALLYEAGSLPPVTAVDLQLIYFEDSDGGIAEWLQYMASLLDDVDVHINHIN